MIFEFNRSFKNRSIYHKIRLENIINLKYRFSIITIDDIISHNLLVLIHILKYYI